MITEGQFLKVLDKLVAEVDSIPAGSPFDLTDSELSEEVRRVRVARVDAHTKDQRRICNKILRLLLDEQATRAETKRHVFLTKLKRAQAAEDAL